ncbi:WYL domain-containing protein [Streptomyces sp. NPDC048483]|uniref:WYL domain-containing protein n=1 Tax=Streptomyces sp. NPDC048483 TaxID=3154927 RepID=UPI0034291AC9
MAKAGTWYLVADHKSKPRLFRTDRLSQVRVLEPEARRRPGVALTQVWHGPSPAAVRHRRPGHRPFRGPRGDDPRHRRVGRTLRHCLNCGFGVALLAVSSYRYGQVA